jgi:23S rRNA pseudouridine2604 synthase
MPRPTLKLPAKPATTTDDAWAPRRKPLRGASKTAKPLVVGQRAARVEPPSSEARKPFAGSGRATPRFEPETAPARERVQKQAPKQTPERGADRDRPPPRPLRGAPPPKSYPKRGVARSTGARAIPPPRIYDEDRAPWAPEPPIAAPDPAPAPQRQPPAAAAATPASAAPRRPQNEPPRLAKRVSEMAQCSRRQADEWIENGWVRVDGVVVTTLGIRVHPNAKIEIKEEASRHQSETVTILLNTPLAVDCKPCADGGNPLLPLLRPENRWAEDESRQTFKASHLRGLAQAGKLDSESTGMLVFTQEGSVARRITGDDTRLEKEYMVRVEGELSPEGMKLLNHGLELDEVKLKRAQVSWQNEQQLRFVLHESKKGQIQRMCELVGLSVVSIKRIRIGSVSLGKLPAGQWRYLRDNERF